VTKSDLCGVKNLILCFLLACATGASAQSSSEQLWVEADVYAWLSRSVRFLGVAQTTQDKLVGSRDLYAGAFVDFGLKPILRDRIDSIDWNQIPMDYLRLRIGAAYLTPLNTDKTSHELRGVVDLTPRLRFWANLLVAIRNRTEWRFIDGSFSFRYRPRIWIERTMFDVAGVPLTPYVSSELFFDARKGGFYRQRTLVGAAFGVSSWFAPEMQFVYQRDWNGDGVNIFAMDFLFSFYL
jgi:hypothetical protein